jgi:transcription elongation GreA/GreB family factor
MTTTTAIPPYTAVLTRDGRARLTDRLRDLDTRVLPQLRENIWSKDRGWSDDAALAAAIAERQSIKSALAISVDAESFRDDPDVVEIGDWVTVRDDDGREETYRIVEPIEAPLDDVRVSSTSPFAIAALGGRVGDDIHIRPLVGEAFRYRIVRTWRTDPKEAA